MMHALPLVRRLVAVVFLVVLAVLPAVVRAAGMSLPGRGARPLGLAGSFVAGADDGGALYYNPAGFADIPGLSFLVDGGLTLQRTVYTRVDSGGNVLPTVGGDMDILPLPTLVLTYKPKRAPWFTIAGGAWVPYLGLESWPADGPQRYSVINTKGSTLVVLELAAAFRVHEHVWLGIGLQDMLIRFQTETALSACSQLNCAPEDPSFDAPTRLSATSGFTPSAVIGAILAWNKVRAGVSLQLPFWVRASGTVQSRLPTDPMFANAVVVGDQATVAFNLPVILRAGVQWRPREWVRAELGFDYESWSMQDKLVVQPQNIYIDKVPGIGRYYLSTMTLDRSMVDTFSAHIGGEADLWKKRLIVRLGYLFESSATPNETLAVLTPDGLKNMITVGLGMRWRWFRLDVGYGHIFMPDRNVTNSRSLQLNPIQPSLAVPVGNGHYQFDTDIVSAGAEGRFL